MSYLDAWRRFADVSGGGRPLCRAGPLMRVVAGRWGDLMARVTGREPEVNSAAVQLSDRFHCFSSRRTEELGYRVRPADESIRDAWQWFVEHGYVK